MTSDNYRRSMFFFVVFYSVHFGQAIPVRADEAGDLLKPGTVWKGEFILGRNDYLLKPKPSVMILYVKQCKGATLEALTWYPTDKNRLLLVTGNVGKAGKITLMEQKLIHDDSGFGVVPALKFTGQVKKNTIQGSAEWTGPNFNGPIKGKFFLKRVD